ncbi:MAG TPA: hypothetical protein VEA59_05360 [Patescibacteria group bacterium]|nr:hypothetical protein [Patescibacteria group bacterium]
MEVYVIIFVFAVIALAIVLLVPAYWDRRLTEEPKNDALEISKYVWYLVATRGGSSLFLCEFHRVGMPLGSQYTEKLVFARYHPELELVKQLQLGEEVRFEFLGEPLPQALDNGGGAQYNPTNWLRVVRV